MSDLIKWRTTEVKGEHPDYDITITEEHKGYYRANRNHKRANIQRSTWANKISDLKSFVDNMLNDLS